MPIKSFKDLRSKPITEVKMKNSAKAFKLEQEIKKLEALLAKKKAELKKL